MNNRIRTMFPNSFIALITWLFVFQTKQVLGQQLITCAATPLTVTEDETAELICFFHNDPLKNKADFYVYRFSSDDKTTVKIIALCNWNDNKYSCEVNDDYIVNTAEISQNVTITIPSARQIHGANYMCKPLPARQSPTVGHCSLTVKKRVNVTCDTTSPVLLGQRASITCLFSEGVGVDDVKLQRINFSPSARPEDIWRCYENNICDFKTEGYELSLKTSSYIRFNIPSVSSDHAGYYRCARLNESDITSGRCPIRLLTGLTDGANQSGEKLYHLMVVLLVFTLLTMMIASVMLVVLCRKQRWACLRRRQY